MKKTTLIMFATVIGLGLGFNFTQEALASEIPLTDTIELSTNVLEKSIPATTPYIVNVQQLAAPLQVSFYTDDTDSDRNITTKATQGYLLFNSVPANPLQHVYVKIIEDTTNLTVVQGDMGRQGREYTFAIGPNAFLNNQYYTIYHSYKQSDRGTAIGRFKATSGLSQLMITN